MASQGPYRRPEEFCGEYLYYTTEVPDDDSDLLKPLHYRVTLEGGVVKLWLKGRRHGKTI